MAKNCSSSSIPQDDDANEVGILLMGVTGHGKSATGNSILGRREFISRGGGCSVTKDYHVGFTKVRGRVLKVVDIPGFTDTDESTASGQHAVVINALTKVLTKFPDGFHAVLLVVSYTNRLTEELQESMRYIMRHFDEGAFKTHGVLLLTSGDSFERDYGKGTSVNRVLASGYQRILDICGGRCLLFDNVTRDEEQRRAQVDELLSIIDNMRSGGAKYIPHICRYKGGMHGKEQFERDRQRVAQMEKVSSRLGLLKEAIHEASRLPYDVRANRVPELKREIFNIEGVIDALDIIDNSLKEKLLLCLDMIDDMCQPGEVVGHGREELISDMQKDLDNQTEGNSFWESIKEGLGFVVQLAARVLKLLF